MARSVRSKKLNRERARFLRKTGLDISEYVSQIPAMIPENTCEHCHYGGHVGAGGDVDEDGFDENGYPIRKTTIKRSGTALPIESFIEIGPKAEVKVFRLLDLPPEIRNRIYEFVARRPKQPVCIPDRLLRPTQDFNEIKFVLRECKGDLICLPCQLNQFTGVGDFGLSRANQQLHNELSLLTYAVNTFSLHNLFYLNTFLRVIGPKARHNLTSLRFGWYLPEEEAGALGLSTSIKDTYELLLECKSLESLSVDFDVDNLRKWQEDGTQRLVPLNMVYDFPFIALMYDLRGLKDIRVAWKEYQGLEGMQDWAKLLAGYWRLEKGKHADNAKPVEAKAHVSNNGHWHYIHWKAGKKTKKKFAKKRKRVSNWASTDHSTYNEPYKPLDGPAQQA